MLDCLFPAASVSSWTRSLLLGALLIGLMALAPQAADAQDPGPLSLQSTAVPSLQSVPIAQMPPLSNAALRARDAEDTAGPYRFAEPIDVALSPAYQGRWDEAKDGTRIWRLRIASDGALSVNLGFSEFDMPPGGKLYVYAPETETMFGPFTAIDNETHGELWTPPIPGDDVIIEVNIPAERADALRLTLGHVNHGYRSLDRSKQSGSCNIDVVCPEGDDWREQIRSVGAYSLNGSIICSGVLVNNTDEDKTPYFLTADHCGVSSRNASSMVVFWNYENSTCRSGPSAGGRGDGTLNQFNSGAILRSSYSGETPGIEGGPDFALVELDDPVDPAYNVFYAGWDRADAATDEAITIHHPQGQEKRISFELDPTTVTSYLRADSSTGPTHLRVGDWDVGTTEPGSSGSPLFDPQQHVIGVLSGGFAACGNNEPDWYGRFAVAWTGGGTSETSLRPWLDPVGTNPVSLEGDDFREDITPPARIADLQITAVTAESITLTWTAPGDDGDEGVADFYELRYDTAPILTNQDFDDATPVDNLPAPEPAGTEQTTTVSGLEPDTPYYFAITARDESSNISEIGATRENAVILQESFVLKSPFPNPFQSSTTVQFAINEPETVTITLYDALGRWVRTAYRRTPPTNTLQDVRIDNQGLASGRYFIRVTGETFSSTLPVTLVK